ncbi:hypothetical protein J6590_088451 [Homalodisca vitripennis]|nr:hypothetical protein J6590_088451 [Homalodisca vitripennis]
MEGCRLQPYILYGGNDNRVPVIVSPTIYRPLNEENSSIKPLNEDIFLVEEFATAVISTIRLPTPVVSTTESLVAVDPTPTDKVSLIHCKLDCKLPYSCPK